MLRCTVAHVNWTSAVLLAARGAGEVQFNTGFKLTVTILNAIFIDRECSWLAEAQVKCISAVIVSDVSQSQKDVHFAETCC